MMVQLTTIDELLYWSYANLAMAHAAVTARSERYGPTHFMIRNRLYSGLRNGAMEAGALADDERLKMLLPQACCYCGSRRHALLHVVGEGELQADLRALEL